MTKERCNITRMTQNRRATMPVIEFYEYLHQMDEFQEIDQEVTQTD